MLSDLRELYKFRELLAILVIRDLKVRYKNSYLGILWSMISPLMQVIVITIVMKQFNRLPVENYSAYLFAAFLPFLFFQLTLLDSTHSIAMHERTLRMVYFPREVIPLSIVIANLIHFLIAIGMFLVYRLATPLFQHFRFEWTIPATILFLPALILLEVMLVTGLAFWFSALNVFYKDVRYLLSVSMQVLYFMLPILYFAEMVQTSGMNERSGGLVFILYMMNPLATIVTAFRKALLPPVPENVLMPSGSIPLDPIYLVWAVFISFVLLVSGYAFFNRRKWEFVERT